jgi:hypothetical protein
MRIGRSASDTASKEVECNTVTSQAAARLVLDDSVRLAFIAVAGTEWRNQMETETSGNGGRGTETGADTSEAGGRGAQTAYTCIACGTVNYVDPNWSWFTCWKCNLQKPLPLPGR